MQIGHAFGQVRDIFHWLSKLGMHLGGQLDTFFTDYASQACIWASYRHCHWLHKYGMHLGRLERHFSMAMQIWHAFGQVRYTFQWVCKYGMHLGRLDTFFTGYANLACIWAG